MTTSYSRCPANRGWSVNAAVIYGLAEIANEGQVLCVGAHVLRPSSPYTGSIAPFTRYNTPDSRVSGHQPASPSAPGRPPMFTGIIEEIGVVYGVTPGEITIGAETVMSDLSLGQSIAIDGVDLTVAAAHRALVPRQRYGRDLPGDRPSGR